MTGLRYGRKGDWRWHLESVQILPLRMRAASGGHRSRSPANAGLPAQGRSRPLC